MDTEKRYYIKRAGNNGKAHIFDTEKRWFICGCGRPAFWGNQNKKGHDSISDFFEQFSKLARKWRCGNCLTIINEEISEVL